MTESLIQQQNNLTLAEIAKHKAKIEQEQKQLNVKLKILEHYPDTLIAAGIEPRYVQGSGYKCDGGLCFENFTRKNLPMFYAAFPGLPLVKLKGTFTSLFPLVRLTDTEQNNKQNDIILCAPYTFQMPGTDAPCVRWFTQLGDLIVEIEVRLYPDAAYYEQFDNPHKRDNKGKPVSEWRVIGLPNGNQIRWATIGNMPNAFTIYWLESETERIEDAIH